ncbi:MAG: hypothetical protein NVSMB46_01830 [Candidatus Saccharimonadales bacterium]
MAAFQSFIAFFENNTYNTAFIIYCQFMVGVNLRLKVLINLRTHLLIIFMRHLKYKKYFE